MEYTREDRDYLRRILAGDQDAQPPQAPPGAMFRSGDAAGGSGAGVSNDLPLDSSQFAPQGPVYTLSSDPALDPEKHPEMARYQPDSTFTTEQVQSDPDLSYQEKQRVMGRAITPSQAPWQGPVSADQMKESLSYQQRQQAGNDPDKISQLYSANQSAETKASAPATPAPAGPPPAPQQPSGPPVLPGSAKPSADAGPTIGRLPLAVATGPGKLTLDVRGQQEAWDIQNRALQAQGAAQTVGSEQQYEARQQAIADYRKQMAIDNAADAKMREQLDAHRARIAQRMADIQAERVDPDRYVHNMTWWQKALAGVSILFGAAPQVMSGGQMPNSGIMGVKNAIDEDIKQQERDIESDRKGLDLDNNLYAMNLAAYKDKSAAAAATRADMWKLWEWNIQSIGEKFGGQENAAKTQLMTGQARENHEKELAEAAMRYKLVTRESYAKQATAGIDRDVGEAMRAAQRVAAGESRQPTPGAGRPVAPPSKPAAGGEPPVQVAPLKNQDQSRLTFLGRSKEGMPLWVEKDADVEARIKKGEDPWRAYSGTATHIVTQQGGQFVKTDMTLEGKRTQPTGTDKPLSPKTQIRVNDAKIALDEVKHVKAGFQTGADAATMQARYETVAKKAEAMGVSAPKVDVTEWDPRGKGEAALNELERALTREWKENYSTLKAGGEPDTAEEASP